MQKVIGFILAFGMIAVVPGLLQAMSHEKDLPAAEGKALHQYITEASPYEQWALWPGKDKLYKGTEPHGALLTTYVNEPALQALKKNEVLPEGGGWRNPSPLFMESYCLVLTNSQHLKK